MEIRLKKQPEKYLKSVDLHTRKKLLRALDQLARLEGNIVPLSGQKTVTAIKLTIIAYYLSGSKAKL